VFQPIFFARSIFLELMNWQAAVERTVTGLGYDLVDCERSARGLLRVFIDRIEGQAYSTGPGEFITVDDCELVTRQLQYVLEVEGCNYERLEVSSPGLDRPLKREADYQRFAGCEIDLTLKMPLAGRKKFRGALQPRDGGWRLVFNDGKADQALDFSLDEVREASLAPVIDFKGRRAGSQDKKADGGRTQ
jgi:ribosome maturation factor RimP